MSDDRSEKDHAELVLLYESSVAEISGFKANQWSVTNYCLLAQAALVAAAQVLSQEPRTLSSGEGCALITISGLAYVLAGALLHNLQKSINARRQRLENVRNSPHFGDAFRSAWKAEKSSDSAASALALAQVIGSMVAVLLVAMTIGV